MPAKAQKPLPPKIGTRATNTDNHPGEVVENLKRKRRTRAEIEADNEKKKKEKEEREKAKARGVKRIAQIENTVAEQDANLVTPKPRPKPRPRYRKIRIRTAFGPRG